MRLRFLAADLAAALVGALQLHWARALQAEHSMDPIESRITAGSASLYSRTVGRGQPAIVLHGGPDFDHRYLLPDLDRLGDRFRLIYYDQRGRGRSANEVRPEDVTLALDLDDLDKVRQFFRLATPVLLGHSWGAVLALEYAVRHVRACPDPDEPGTRLGKRRRRHSQGVSREARRRHGSQREIVASAAYQAGEPEAVAARYRIHFGPALMRPEDYE